MAGIGTGVVEDLDVMEERATDEEFKLATEVAYAAYAQIDGRWTLGEDSDPVDLDFVLYLTAGAHMAMHEMKQGAVQ